MLNNWKLYLHTSPSKKYYVGITKQTCKKRWNNGNGYKKNNYFYSAIIKYGWDNFEHCVLKEGLTEEEAKIEEINLIKELKSNNRIFGYNITSGGDGTSGLSGKLHPFFNKHLSESHRKNMSIARKNYYKNNKINIVSISKYGIKNSQSKSVYCFELKEFFDCISDAKSKYGLNRDSIVNCCNHNQLYHGFHNATGQKLHWIFQSEYKELIQNHSEIEILNYCLEKYNENKKKITRAHSEETKKKMASNHADFSGSNNPSAKKVFCLELNEYFNTIKEASLKYNINKNSICSCCTGKVKSAGRHPDTNEKLHWRYAS